MMERNKGHISRGVLSKPSQANNVRMLQSMTAQIRVKLITEYLAAQYYQRRKVQAGGEKQLNVLELCTNGISLVVLVRSSKGDCLAKGSILLDSFTSHFLLQHIV